MRIRKKKIKKLFLTIRRFRLRLSLNKYKFEEKFLYKLSQLISKYYGKKVEFNIVNLKSIAYNGDIFTQILTLKLKKPKSHPMRRINALLARVVLPEVNTIIERGRLKKEVDFELIDNKYRNLNINYIINNMDNYKDNLNKLLYNIYYKPALQQLCKTNILEKKSRCLNEAYYLKLRNIMFENIKYKIMSGVRLIVKGRLTKRYRADRAVYKLK
jgi:hypothetical protein